MIEAPQFVAAITPGLGADHLEDARPHRWPVAATDAQLDDDSIVRDTMRANSSAASRSPAIAGQRARLGTIERVARRDCRGSW